jgi:hypothetical protein
VCALCERLQLEIELPLDLQLLLQLLLELPQRSCNALWRRAEGQQISRCAS